MWSEQIEPWIGAIIVAPLALAAIYLAFIKPGVEADRKEIEP